MPSVLWRSDRIGSLEQCELTTIPGGHRLSGLVLAAVDRVPVHVVYQVDVDEGWRTRVVRATLFDPDGPRSMQLVADGAGEWRTEGGREEALDGCLDADLEWTPATNTLPIRRLGLAVGARGLVPAVWVRFPTLNVARLEQSYERLSDRRWRYRSPSFEAELTVDSNGLALDYAGVWSAVAHSDPDELLPAPGSGGGAGRGSRRGR